MDKFYKALAAALVGAFVLWGITPAQADYYKPIQQNWEIAAPGANTDAITDVTWASNFPCRVTVQCDTSTVVNLMVSRGGTENALGLNSNTALTAGAVYVFDVPGVINGDTVNVQVETDSAIPMLSLGEVRNQQR